MSIEKNRLSYQVLKNKYNQMQEKYICMQKEQQKILKAKEEEIKLLKAKIKSQEEEIITAYGKLKEQKIILGNLLQRLK